jgi:hypothetical protein
MVLELAVCSGSEVIVTYNAADFRRAKQFGIEVQSPTQFLRYIGELERVPLACGFPTLFTEGSRK